MTKGKDGVSMPHSMSMSVETEVDMIAITIMITTTTIMISMECVYHAFSQSYVEFELSVIGCTNARNAFFKHPML